MQDFSAVVVSKSARENQEQLEVRILSKPKMDKVFCGFYLMEPNQPN